MYTVTSPTWYSLGLEEQLNFLLHYAAPTATSEDLVVFGEGLGPMWHAVELKIPYIPAVIME